MKPEEKIWQILQFIDDSKKLTPKGKLVRVDARKLDKVIDRLDHEYIFEKLQNDEGIIKIHKTPDYKSEFLYWFEVFDGFDKTYAYYQAKEQYRADKVERKKKDRLLDEYQRKLEEYQQQKRPDIFDFGYNRHLIRDDPQRQQMERQTLEGSRWLSEQSRKNREAREDRKYKRILESKEDKRVHAINTLIERAENIKEDEKNFNVDYFYFNFEGGNENLIHVFIPFLEKLKKTGGFKNFERHTGVNQVHFSFQGVNIDNLKIFRSVIMKENMDIDAQTPKNYEKNMEKNDKITDKKLYIKNVGQFNMGNFERPSTYIDQRTQNEKKKWWEKTWVQLLFLFGAIAGIIALII